MDFSDSFRCSATSPKCSPDGKYVAAAVEYRLIVRDVQSLQVAAIWSCLDKIEAIDWAPNSNHILCGLYSRALVQVWSLNDTSWQCKIDEGPAGVASARWSPCGGEIILCADFQIRITIWSLVDRKCMYLNGPKFPDKGFSFSPDGEHVAIAERKDCKDYIAVYATADWKVQNRFPVASTDLADISWAQDGSCISVADTLLQYKLLLYTPQGEELARYSAYDDALGIKDVTWAPHGQLISIGSYDQIARVLNNVTWSPFLECEHPAVISGPSSTTVYREVQEGEGEGGDDAGAPLEVALPARSRSRYAICELPATIPSLKPERNKASPRLGVGLQRFSNDGQYLATRNDNMPQTVWIWDMYRLQLVAVLTQIAAVRDVCWAPDQPQLVLCTGSDKVFLWTPQGVSCVHIPLPGFTASSAMWMRSSSTMLLANKDMFCVVYVR